MTAPEKRRPLPALIFILALTLLTALVWFRVLHRGNGSGHAHAATTTHCPSSSATSTAGTPRPPSTSLPPPRTVKVSVLNATDRAGLAAKTSQTLRHDGFKTAKPGNDDSYNGHGVAQIRYGPGAAGAAKLVSYFLPGSSLVATKSRTAVVTVSLGNRYHALVSRPKVLTRLRHQHIVLTRGAAPTPAPRPTKTSC